ncbi:MAG: alkaline phosphatase family protein [Acidobacteriota bacterium]|nr:alkaline phosphatase family protein [Acidobacteriota bacterium]
MRLEPATGSVSAGSLFPGLSRWAAWALLVLSSLFLGGCEATDDPESSPPQVAIIGWDGATWAVMEPLLRAGQLPNVQALLDRGGRGVLLAEPPLRSPALWTTLATGFPPADHGIHDFQLPDPQTGLPILAATIHRQRAPLWTIASRHEREVGMVGWWTTWPAEPVHGWLVSDHLADNRWDHWAKRPDRESYQLTFPPELAESLRPQAVTAQDVTPETLAHLAAFDQRERTEMMLATRPVIFHGPSVLRHGYATDASNARFAVELLDRNGQPDLFATVFILSDVVGHVFWHHLEPEQLRGPNPAGDRLAETIPNIYRQLDTWTGELLSRLSPETLVLLISDHGMRGTGFLPRPGQNPSGDHQPEGILIAAGPGVPAGADLGEIRQLDFAPTVLAALDLPVAEDMPGRVVRGLLGDRTIRSVETHGDGRAHFDVLETSPAEERYEDRLRSLGYIQ